MIVAGLIIYVFGLFSFLINHKHYLMLLLCFEFMYLGVFVLLMIAVGLYEVYLNIVLYLIMIVCEARLGLSILVMGVYFYGNDRVGTFSFLKC